jgi:23S rRNA (guanine745-N1)-methyltransferase
MEYYRPTQDLVDGYNHKETINVRYETKLEDSKDIKSLFDMTPYRWKSPKDGVERLLNLSELKITVDVNIDIFEKN